jgi:hypothetical protein
MITQGESSQAEDQTEQVELEYHHEIKRENKAMDTKLVAPKFNPNLITKAYGDNLSSGSSKSGGGDHHLPASLFFAHASVKVSTPIGEPILSGEYPKMNKNWVFWMSSTKPNSHSRELEDLWRRRSAL